jgi:hypothetical protein
VIITKTVRNVLLIAGLAVAGTFAATTPAMAAEQDNVFSLHWEPDAQTFTPPGSSHKYEEENYTRTHATAGDITFTAVNDGKGDKNSITMALMYTSNLHIFASKTVGLSFGKVTFVTNWGATKFRVLLWGGTAGSAGWVYGDLYY